jgi:hypothetical protein
MWIRIKVARICKIVVCGSVLRSESKNAKNARKKCTVAYRKNFTFCLKSWKLLLGLEVPRTPIVSIHGILGFILSLLYQIRRPLGLAFAISFVGWENYCCRSINSWTLICSSLPQSPDLLGFPATPPPPHIDSGNSLEP